MNNFSQSWSAALYVRLSKEDELKGESNSISAQREILREYVRQAPDIIVYDFYVDDGWSGTNFDRPDFKRMMSDVYAGKVNCVIVKDLSRFGRNYSRGGEIITDEFARLGVRFIALNNGFDSGKDSGGALAECITVGVTNVINESYAASTSANVRGTLNMNRRQGKFIGSFPSYGYKKDPNDHHKLIIDEEAAAVVRLIFDKFVGGMSVIGIAKELNEMGVPNPSAYKRMKGYNYRHPASEKADGLWPESSVRRILQNEMYVGNMVQGKNRNISYKIKKSVSVSKADWIVVENTHEPIIDRELFDRAQSLFCKGIRKSPKTDKTDLFSGIVRCAECGRLMNKKTNTHDYGTYNYYRCVTHRKMKSSVCKNHTIRIDKLENAVLTYLRTLISIAVRLDEIADRINANPQRSREYSHLESTLKTYQSEYDKCDRMIIDLYPDWKSGIITKEEYISLKQELADKKAGLVARITALKDTIEKFRKGGNTDNEFIANFKKYGNITKLTRPIVTELIDEILVYENGIIEINVKFADAYEQILDYIEANKESLGA